MQSPPRRRHTGVGTIIACWLSASTVAGAIAPLSAVFAQGSESPATQPSLAPSPGGERAFDPAVIAALVGKVKSAREDAGARRSAVESLISEQGSAGVQAVGQLLESESDSGVLQVVIAVLADREADPPAEFAAPLLALLGSSDGVTQREAAAVLGRYRDRATVRRLVEFARDPSASATLRTGAAFALGNHRTQGAARTLIELIQPAQPQRIRAAAFISLAELTGIGEFGSDVARWEKWWDQHRQLSENDWLNALLANLRRAADRANAEKTAVSDRLVESQRQLYRTLPQEDRQARLVALLSDPYEPIRRLAVELSSEFILQRQSQNQAIGAELRAALLARLSDTSASVRQGAARRLGDLDDAGGADKVVEKLTSGAESDPDVLRAYLTLIARVPRAQAVQPAITLMGEPALRRDAANALVKAIDGGLVATDVRLALLSRVRAAAAGAKAPEPEVIELLGRLAQEEDWALIAKWLDNPDAGVRGAAAKAWGASDRPLTELAKWAGDQDVLPRFIEAANRRGADAATLLALVRHRPERAEQEQLTLAWQRAVVAVASRVPARAVLDADKRIELRGGAITLRDQILSAAIAKLSPNGTTQPATDADVYVDLLLTRGEVRLAQGDPAQALVDLRRVRSVQPLSAERTQRCELGMFRATLSAGVLDEAFDLAKSLFAAEPPARESLREAVTQTLITASQRSLKAGQADPARRVLKALRELAGATLTKDIEEKVLLMERGVEALSPQPAPGGATPGTTSPASTTPGTPPAGAAPAAPAQPAVPPATMPAETRP